MCVWKNNYSFWKNSFCACWEKVQQPLRPVHTQSSHSVANAHSMPGADGMTARPTPLQTSRMRLAAQLLRIAKPHATPRRKAAAPSSASTMVAAPATPATNTPHLQRYNQDHQQASCSVCASANLSSAPVARPLATSTVVVGEAVTIPRQNTPNVQLHECEDDDPLLNPDVRKGGSGGGSGGSSSTSGSPPRTSGHLSRGLVSELRLECSTLRDERDLAARQAQATTTQLQELTKVCNALREQVSSMHTQMAKMRAEHSAATARTGVVLEPSTDVSAPAIPAPKALPLDVDGEPSTASPIVKLASLGVTVAAVASGQLPKRPPPLPAEALIFRRHTGSSTGPASPASLGGSEKGSSPKGAFSSGGCSASPNALADMAAVEAKRRMSTSARAIDWDALESPIVRQREGKGVVGGGGDGSGGGRTADGASEQSDESAPSSPGAASLLQARRALKASPRPRSPVRDGTEDVSRRTSDAMDAALAARSHRRAPQSAVPAGRPPASSDDSTVDLASARRSLRSPLISAREKTEEIQKENMKVGSAAAQSVAALAGVPHANPTTLPPMPLLSRENSSREGAVEDGDANAEGVNAAQPSGAGVADPAGPLSEQSTIAQPPPPLAVLGRPASAARIKQQREEREETAQQARRPQEVAVDTALSLPPSHLERATDSSLQSLLRPGGDASVVFGISGATYFAAEAMRLLETSERGRRFGLCF